MQHNMTPKLRNNSVINTSNSEVNEISDQKFKKLIIRMTNEMNKHLSELQENSIKDLNKIKKTM